MSLLGEWHEQPDGGILEIDPSFTPTGFSIELQIILFQGQTKAFWVHQQSGAVLAQVEAGQA